MFTRTRFARVVCDGSNCHAATAHTLSAASAAASASASVAAAARPARDTAWYDVVVSGGGMVGTAMMASLQQLRRRLRTQAQMRETQLERLLLVDKAATRPCYRDTCAHSQLRTVNITPVSSRILDTLGAWGKLRTKHPYYRMSIRHEHVNSPVLPDCERSTSFVMSRLLGTRRTTQPLIDFVDLRTPVGIMCYNAELNAALVDVVMEQAASHDNASEGRDSNSGSADVCGDAHDVYDAVRFASTLTDIVLPPHEAVDGPCGRCVVRGGAAAGSAAATHVRNVGVGGNARQSSPPSPQDAEVLFALLLGCEGRGSGLRHTLATPALQHDYGQTAYVCNVRIEHLDDGNVCAFQNFFRDGKVLGYLPTSGDTANIVFTTTAAHARTLLACSDTELVAELNARLHAFAPDDIPRIVDVQHAHASEAVGAPSPSPPQQQQQQQRVQGCFPLKLDVAVRPCSARAVLLGDAAHSVHPFAGQGLNLGLYDVCALTDVIERAVRAGQDIGSMVAVGQVFTGEMVAHTAPVITGMEVIKQLMYAVPGVSAWGMQLINQLPVVSTFGKDAIMQVASGATFAARHRDCFLLK